MDGMTEGAPAVPPIALAPDTREALWTIGFPVTVKPAGEATDGRIAMLEHLAPRGTGSPLHVHRRDDEWFYVIDGELTFWIGGRVIDAPAGSFVQGPRDIPHTFLVSSEHARFLLGADLPGVDDLERAIAEPAQRLAIHGAATAPPDVARLAAIAAEYDVEILGPPGIPVDA